MHLVPSQRHAYLQQALQVMKSCAEKTDGSTDGSKAFTGEMMILCAEVACQVHVFLNYSHSPILHPSSQTVCMLIFYCESSCRGLTHIFRGHP